MADDALAVDQECLRSAVHAQIQAQGAVCVVDVQLIRVVEILKPLLRIFVDVFVVHAVDQYTLIGQFGQHRVLDPA